MPTPLLAQIYQRQGRLDQAALALDRAIERQPDRPELFRARALLVARPHRRGRHQVEGPDAGPASPGDPRPGAGHSPRAQDSPQKADDHAELGRLLFASGKTPGSPGRLRHRAAHRPRRPQGPAAADPGTAGAGAVRRRARGVRRLSGQGQAVGRPAGDPRPGPARPKGFQRRDRRLHRRPVADPRLGRRFTIAAAGPTCFPTPSSWRWPISTRRSGSIPAWVTPTAAGDWPWSAWDAGAMPWPTSRPPSGWPRRA